MTSVTELRERFEKLIAQAENDDDVARELRALAYDLEKAAKSEPDTGEAPSLVDCARDARGYADQLDRWRSIVRKRPQPLQEEN